MALLDPRPPTALLPCSSSGSCSNGLRKWWGALPHRVGTSPREGQSFKEVFFRASVKRARSRARMALVLLGGVVVPLLSCMIVAAGLPLPASKLHCPETHSILTEGAVMFAVSLAIASTIDMTVEGELYTMLSDWMRWLQQGRAVGILLPLVFCVALLSWTVVKLTSSDVTESDITSETLTRGQMSNGSQLVAAGGSSFWVVLSTILGLIGDVVLLVTLLVSAGVCGTVGYVGFGVYTMLRDFRRLMRR